MREEEIKPKKPQVMHNTTAHLPLSDAQPIPEQWSVPPSQLYPSQNGDQGFVAAHLGTVAREPAQYCPIHINGARTELFQPSCSHKPEGLNVFCPLNWFFSSVLMSCMFKLKMKC